MYSVNIFSLSPNVIANLPSPRVFCVTWNVNGRVPPPSLDPLLKDYFVKGETDSLVPDIFAIG